MDNGIGGQERIQETPRYEDILARMLERVPNAVDKREGSIIYDALAPVAAELAQWYQEMSLNRELSYADTATGAYLERRTAEFGVRRLPAIAAKRRGRFYAADGSPKSVPIGSRFAIEDLTWRVTALLSPGESELTCETEGVEGNRLYGELTPIDYVAGLARAELGDILVPGEDTESDDALRARYLEAINEQPFGGNMSDYRTKLTVMPGVGGVKVFPAWQGGGTVKCTLISSDYQVPSAELIAEVQEQTDPKAAAGMGGGFAPIGHQVTIAAVRPVELQVETTLQLDKGMTLGQVQGDVEQVLQQYMHLLRESWKDEEKLIVRISQMEARILTVPGVADVSGTTLNEAAVNLELSEEEVPVLKEVKLHGA